MKRKVIKSIKWLIITALLGFLTYWFTSKGYSVIPVILGAILGLTVESVAKSVQDISDIKTWQTEQRRLKRGGFIDDDTMIRISFAYVFRIKVDGKYFLVMNNRHTGKYQPIGGVYKMSEDEKRYISRVFGCMDDNMIPVDASSRNDYRLRIKSKYLRTFVRRFNSKKASRENIQNLSREFREELIDTGILDKDTFTAIKYEYVGRYYSGVKLTQHFDCYELLMGDVVNLLLTPDQEADIRRLLSTSDSCYGFFTDEQITKLGIDSEHENLREIIADHTVNILENKTDGLETAYKYGSEYTAEIEEN